MYDFHQITKKLQTGSVPIYRTVAECLRAAILDGSLANESRLPSEESLASELGINHLTLRKSLKILADMKLITQCQGRGTFVSYCTDEYLRIGIVVSAIPLISDDLYVLRLMAGLNQALRSHYHGSLELLDVSPGNFPGFLEQINHSRCDGLVVIDTRPAVFDYLNQSIFDHLPMVFINALSETVSGGLRFLVRTDEDIIARAVRHFYDLGHRKIGFIQACSYESFDADPGFLRRESSFRSSCSGLGLSQRHIRLDLGSWYGTTRRLTQELFCGPDRPTACLLPGYIYSSSAWQALLEMGIRIPEDLSFIGFDVNLRIFPRMSAMMQPLSKLAAKATELVFASRNKGKHLKQHLYKIPAEYVDNGSCRRLVES